MDEGETNELSSDDFSKPPQNMRALGLRWMNVLYELGLQSKGTLMPVPTNTPTPGVSMGFPPLRTGTIQDLAAQKKDEQRK